MGGPFSFGETSGYSCDFDGAGICFDVVKCVYIRADDCCGRAATLVIVGTLFDLGINRSIDRLDVGAIVETDPCAMASDVCFRAVPKRAISRSKFCRDAMDRGVLGGDNCVFDATDRRVVRLADLPRPDQSLRSHRIVCRRRWRDADYGVTSVWRR